MTKQLYGTTNGLSNYKLNSLSTTKTKYIDGIIMSSCMIEDEWV